MHLPTYRPTYLYTVYMLGGLSAASYLCALLVSREYAADVSGSFARGWPIDLPGAGIVHVALKIFAQVI